MNQLSTLSEIISMLKRRWWLIMLVTIVGTALGLNFALNMSKLYQATAVVQIESPQIATPDTLAERADSSHQLRLIEQRLMARDNLIEMIERYGLYQPEGAPPLPMEQRVFLLRSAATVTQLTAGGQPWQPGIIPSGLLITVQSEEPQIAAAVANDLLGQVVAFGRSRDESRARETLVFFEAEQSRIDAEIVALEERIAAFKEANANSLPDNLPTQRGQLSRLQDAELELDQQLIELDANSARTRAAERARQVALLNDQRALVQERIAETEAALEQAPDVELALNTLERERAQLQDQYSVITRRLADAEMASALSDQQRTAQFEVLETAVVPNTPISRSRARLAMMGAIGSLIAGLILAVVLELFSPVIRNSEQLEKALNVQPVISVPYIKARRRGRLSLAWLFGALAIGLGVALAAGRTLQDKLSGVLGRSGGVSARGES
ncbi:GumC family protein [Pseudaestuariivita sp.]|uniref:GumC family protein n=1 Tax=Pseudaestuariivita sp. TaxID=2211669 RepID=UPI00405877E2